MYDVIIAGASFAGLAAANQIRDHRVLLIDRKPVGAGQTSACGTILPVLGYWDLTETIYQIHSSIILHTARHMYEFPTPYRWCTFDYLQLCKTLFKRSGADFLQAAVLGADADMIYTNHGAFKTHCIIDASGWKATLASSHHPDFSQSTPMNFGIETVASMPSDDLVSPHSLHFLYDPAILSGGVGWVFPRGETASIGVGSYRGAVHLQNPLSRLMEKFDVKSEGVHGTYFPQILRKPVVGSVFVVGDAAGMCIGLTGEGIRPAMYFGERCGQIVNKVLAHNLTLAEGLFEYNAFVDARRKFFRVFSLAQRILTQLPPPWIDTVARIVSHERVLPWVLDQYWGLTREWIQSRDG